MSRAGHGHEDFEDCDAIVRGAVHEMEHTSDWETAMDIAADHLREREDYYDVLEGAMGEGEVRPNGPEAALLPVAIELATTFPKETSTVLRYGAMVAFPPYGLARIAWGAGKWGRDRAKRAMGYKENAGMMPFGFDEFGDDEWVEPTTVDEPWRKPVFRGITIGDVVLVGRQQFTVLRVLDEHSFMGQKPGAKRKAFHIWHEGPTVQVREMGGSWDTTYKNPIVLEVPFDQVRLPQVKENGIFAAGLRRAAPAMKPVVQNIFKWLVGAYRLALAGAKKVDIVMWLRENKIAAKLANAMADAVIAVVAEETAGAVRAGGRSIQRKALGEVAANPGRYYVWAMTKTRSGKTTMEGPWGPYPFQNARTYARIAATEGEMDRVVTEGADPATLTIKRIYEAGTGSHLYTDKDD
jgi:hypothetical protein